MKKTEMRIFRKRTELEKLMLLCCIGKYLVYEGKAIAASPEKKVKTA